MLLLIALLTFGSITLLVIGLNTRPAERTPADWLAPTRTSEGSLDSIEGELSASFRDRIALPFLRRVANFAARLTPGGATQAVEEKLETAGRPWKMGYREFMGLRVVSVLASVLIAITAVNLVAMSPGLKIICVVILTLCGAALPDYMLESAIRKRQTDIRKVLADTLDLLTVCVGAGLGLDGAMQRVVEKLKSPFSDELSRAIQEMRIGKTRAEALREMAKRIRLPEVSSFVAAICQADQLGVSISKVISVQCDTLRSVRSQRARELAAKLPVKLLIPLVFFIFPAIFVVVVGPGVIQIIRTLGTM